MLPGVPDSRFCFDPHCIGDTASSPGSAATKAEARKRVTYSNLMSTYRFEPVAVETTGVLGKSSARFIAELGHRITGSTGDRRETHWLRQRLSIAVIRGNAASVLATGNI